MAKNARPGFFRAAFEAVIEARQIMAHRYANGALLLLDDEALKARGLTREELRKNTSFGYRL